MNLFLRSNWTNTKLAIVMAGLGLVSCKTTRPGQGDSAILAEKQNQLSPSHQENRYPQCQPQTNTVATNKGLEADTPAFKRPKQLAPGFFEDMSRCSDLEIRMVQEKSEGLELNPRGALTPAGDCEWRSSEANGSALLLQCHFHSAPEFLAKPEHQRFFGRDLKSTGDDVIAGELHCIFPQPDDPNHPVVFGARVKCKEQKAHATHEPQSHNACPSEILTVFGDCTSGYACCQNGTLTKPHHKHSAAEAATRPHFRICTDEVVEVDCGLLNGMHAHTSNAVDVGPVYEGRFQGAHSPEATPSSP